MEIDYITIGEQIRRLRTSKRMSQAKLGELSGVEPSYVSHIERGVAKPSLPTLISIANVFGVTLDELVYSNIIKCSHISTKLIEEQLQDCSADELIALVEIIKTTKKILRNKNKNDNFYY